MPSGLFCFYNQPVQMHLERKRERNNENNVSIKCLFFKKGNSDKFFPRIVFVHVIISEATGLLRLAMIFPFHSFRVQKPASECLIVFSCCFVCLIDLYFVENCWNHQLLKVNIDSDILFWKLFHNNLFLWFSWLFEYSYFFYIWYRYILNLN